MLDSLDSRHALRVQESSSNTDSVRAEAQRFDHVCAPVDAAVDEDTERSCCVWRPRIFGREPFGVLERVFLRTRGDTELWAKKVWRVFPDLEQDVQRRPSGVQ